MLKNDSGADQTDLKNRLKSVENTRIMRDYRNVSPETFNEGENGTRPEQDDTSVFSTPDIPHDNINEPEAVGELQDVGIKVSDKSIITGKETSRTNNELKNNIVTIKIKQSESATPESMLSELIMPDGDKINIDRLRDRVGDSRTIEHRRVVLPDSVESIWEKTLQEITRLETETVISPDIEEIPVPKLSFIERITQRFKREKLVLEDYDPDKHGPLVNLTLPTNFLYDEIEVYEVNVPYAYVRVVYNPNSHSYLYQTLEPELTEGEKQLFAELKVRLGETLDVNLTQLEEKGAKKYLRDKVTDILWDYQIKIDTISFTKIMYFLFTEFMGYGIIDPLMHDANLEDISCDGPHSSLFVYHRKYDSIEAEIKFDNESKLDGFVTRIAQICGRHISIADPLLDATMPDGSRIQLTLGREVTTRGSSFTIRKFKESPLTPPDLIDFHTYSTSIASYMWLAAENNKNLIFAGGTASGKTTSMNAMALFIPPQTKIVSIEDTRELNLPHPNWIAGVTRETFTGGEAGSIDMYDLLRAALRQRPEYLLVGEVRGEEAYVLFQAMSTGHTTFSTMHADSVQSVVHRLENPPINVPRIMLQALDVVIIQVQVRVGEERVRRAKSITEIVGVDARTGELLTNEVFTWNASKDEFIYSGRSYVLESIMQNRGWNDERLQIELKQRQEILEWARMKNVKHYEDVAKIVVSYYREPKTLMEIVRKELYGN
ncbi:MAG: type II/IV secretion system ATPase subunit [Methanosarcinales archaeon]|nr:type II/IV secretion system ATPase subunit [Methanosarcinales archaeon]